MPLGYQILDKNAKISLSNSYLPQWDLTGLSESIRVYIFLNEGLKM